MVLPSIQKQNTSQADKPHDNTKKNPIFDNHIQPVWLFFMCQIYQYFS